MTATLVATPDPQCTCGFTTTRTRSGHQWVFRRDPACLAHSRRVLDVVITDTSNPFDRLK